MEGVRSETRLKRPSEALIRTRPLPLPPPVVPEGFDGSDEIYHYITELLLIMIMSLVDVINDKAKFNRKRVSQGDRLVK